MNNKIKVTIVILFVLAFTAMNDYQPARYEIYQPLKGMDFTYLLNTQTGDCWRMVLNVNDAGPAWVYVPKQPPQSWERMILK